MNKLWKAPFFHFLLIGAALFLINWIFNKQTEDPEEYTIIINDSDLNRLALAYQKNWGNLPDSNTMNLLLEEEINSEILYREALRMQLDHNDEIIRRRLKQKYEFLIKDLKEQDIPTLTDLKTFYQNNQDQYKSKKNYSFNQVYFSPDNHTDPKREAETLFTKKKDNQIQNSDISKAGDKFHLPKYFAEKDLEAVRQSFGKAFADSLFTIEKLGWQRPIPSGYGVHLVEIIALNQSKTLPFEVAKEQIEQDWKQAQLNDFNEQLMSQLKEQYQIEYQFSKKQQNDE